MAPDTPHDHPGFTAHVFAEHGWTDLDYVLADLRDAVAADHRSEHERASRDREPALPHPHSHEPDRIGDAPAPAG